MQNPHALVAVGLLAGIPVECAPPGGGHQESPRIGLAELFEHARLGQCLKGILEGQHLGIFVAAVFAGPIAEFRVDDRLVREGVAHLVEKVDGALVVGAAVKDAKVHGPAGDVAGVLGFVGRAGPVGGGGLRHQASVGIFLIEFIVDALDEGAAVGDFLALVAGAPQDEAGTVIIAKNHFAPHLLVDMALIVLNQPLFLVVEPPHGNLFHGGESDAVAIEKSRRVIGIVAAAQELGVERLDLLDVRKNDLRRDAAAVIGMIFMAGDAGEKDRLAVEQHLRPLCYDRTNPELAIILVQQHAILPQGDAKDVEMRGFGVPQLRRGDAQLRLPDFYGIGIDGERGFGCSGTSDGGPGHILCEFGSDIFRRNLCGKDIQRHAQILRSGRLIGDHGLDGEIALDGEGDDLRPHDVLRRAGLEKDVVNDAGVIEPVHFVKGDDILARAPGWIVDAHGDGIGVAIVEHGADVEGKGGVAAFVIADVLAVDPDIGDIVDGVEMEFDGLSRETVRNLEWTAVPDAVFIVFGGFFIAAQFVFDGGQDFFRPGAVVIIAAFAAGRLDGEVVHDRDGASRQGQGVIRIEALFAPGAVQGEESAVLLLESRHDHTVLIGNGVAVDVFELKRCRQGGHLGLWFGGHGEPHQQQDGGESTHQ